MILLPEVIARASFLPGIWKQVDWSYLGWLSRGAMLGTPVGTYALASIPARTMRAAIASLLAQARRAGPRFESDAEIGQNGAF